MVVVMVTVVVALPLFRCFSLYISLWKERERERLGEMEKETKNRHHHYHRHHTESAVVAVGAVALPLVFSRALLLSLVCD